MGAGPILGDAEPAPRMTRIKEMGSEPAILKGALERTFAPTIGAHEWSDLWDNAKQ